MQTLEVAGHRLQVNEEGFLLDSSQWTPQIAEEIAREVGVWPLTEKHWAVITFCREDAAREGQSPGLRRIAKTSGVDMKALYQLFPKGPGKLAARIAGLPKPQGCV
jgi:dissimilatory sulfite reductase related protein